MQKSILYDVNLKVNDDRLSMKVLSLQNWGWDIIDIEGLVEAKVTSLWYHALNR